MKRTILLSFLFWAGVTSSCEINDDLPAEVSDTIIYSNSFENANDLTDYVGMRDLEGDAAPNGGDSSLFISGGCFVPHLYYPLGPFEEDLELKMKIWGKTNNGGRVYLTNQDRQFSMCRIFIQDSIWTSYESDSTVFIPKAELAYLKFVSGGIFSSSTFFDLLEIEKVE